jgi:trehalose 6-phosphate phosphatase
LAAVSDAARRLDPVEPAMLERIAGRAREAAVLLDFDGTLSPIVPDPEDARALPGAPETLAALGARFGAVAVISGRPVTVLQERLGEQPGVRLIGLYGAEQLVDGSVRVHPDAARRRATVRDAADALDALLHPLDGVTVERKGLSVAVHFRRARDPRKAQANAEPTVAAIAERTGLGEVRRGRLVLEIGPGIEIDKGTAARALLREVRAQAAFAAGDDAGDADVFRAVGELPLALRVAVMSGEAPAALLAEADASVTGPAGLLEVLSALVRAADP